jgi:hypothetical protein
VDIKLGRLSFVAALEDVVEQLGGGLETVGARAVAGEPRARSRPLTLPIRAEDAAADPVGEGARLRRAVRSLLENPQALAQGLYLTVAYDSELNGWLRIGGGEISEEQVGVTFGEWKLSLSDVYSIGSLRTLRPARRLTVADRRLATVPRDLLRALYSTDFAAVAAAAVHTIPPGYSDVVGLGGQALVPQAVVTKGGNVGVLAARTHGEVVHYEQGEADLTNFSDVLVHDRRGLDTSQQDTGWEEVYGPDYPLTAGEIPTVSNGICRARQTAGTTVALERWVVGTGWVEVGRLLPWLEYATTFPPTLSQATVLRGARVVEWTPERAVVAYVAATATGERADIYITLQRGWDGPRVEVYATPRADGSGAGAQLRFYAYDTTPFSLVKSHGTGLVVERTSDEAAGSGQWWVDEVIGKWNVGASEPWAALVDVRGDYTVSVAVQRTLIEMITFSDSYAYGSTRQGIGLSSLYAPLKSYLSVHFGIARNGALAQAETYRNAGSGTTSQVADGLASGGQAVQETQATAAAHTVLVSAAQMAALGLAFGDYRAVARVRAASAGTASLRAHMVGTESAAAITPSLNSASYSWYDLGELTYDAATTGFALQGWRSGTAGNIIFDRFVLVPVEGRGPGASRYDGARDLVSRALLDCRAVPELVTR